MHVIKIVSFLKLNERFSISKANLVTFELKNNINSKMIRLVLNDFSCDLSFSPVLTTNRTQNLSLYPPPI